MSNIQNERGLFVFRVISDAPYRNGERVISFIFDPNNDSDKHIIEELEKLCMTQKQCENCKNFYRDGYFCGYRACCCRIHGCLENLDNPHYDMDGSKCNDYESKG